MKLFMSPTSPYARKVLVLAHEVGLMAEIACVTVQPFDAPPDLVAVNPLCKVPTLVLDDGRVILDSRAICAYLDTRHHEPRLFPSGGMGLDAQRTHVLADGIMDAAVALRLESLRPQPDPASRKRYLGAVRRSLAVLAAEVADLGAEPTIAHIALGCALGYLDLRLPEEPWRDDCPELARWYTAWANRPSMQSTAPPASSPTPPPSP